jgi:hypothetical protein
MAPLRLKMRSTKTVQDLRQTKPVFGVVIDGAENGLDNSDESFNGVGASFR